MTRPIGSVGDSPGVRRARRRAKGEGAQASGPAEEVHAASGAAPIPPLDPAAHEGPPVLSAQLIGQSDPAESAESAKSAARKAHSAYLSVEWSGPRDRRTRRGRIAKTEV